MAITKTTEAISMSKDIWDAVEKLRVLERRGRSSMVEALLANSEPIKDILSMNKEKKEVDNE